MDLHSRYRMAGMNLHYFYIKPCNSCISQAHRLSKDPNGIGLIHLFPKEGKILPIESLKKYRFLRKS